jgi:phosphotriesterase-related protein
MSSRVRTVLGEVDPEVLGRTDYHEHLFQVSPLLPGEELDDPVRSEAEAERLRESGFAAMVDATPVGLGRQPADVAAISAATGLHVVATTGAHRDEHYPPGHWLRDLDEDALADRFTGDVADGMAVEDAPAGAPGASTPDGRPVRAGMLKAGVGYWRISAFEARVLGAVASAHARTGAPVMVHLEYGTAALEVLEVLRGHGVAASAVVLAHVDRLPDPVLHAELAAAGAYLGYDGFARARSAPDSVLIDCLIQAAELGAKERLLLGGDVARRTRYVAYGGMPGLAYLGQRVVPRLERSGYGDLVQAALVDNPARLLTLREGAG